jgi:maleylacetoacetate isomerase
MNLKNIDYEYKSIDILGGGQYRDEFKRLNPKEEVPALQIDNHLLVQSVNEKLTPFFYQTKIS